jgi:hypothetical protein
MHRIVVVSMLVLLAGCTGTGTKMRLRSLDDAINAYAQALRWGRYDDAQQFHMTRDGGRIVLDEHVMADIRVTGYAVRETVFDEEGTTAQVQAEFKYFITSRGTLQSRVVPQTWWYDEESKRWFLDSGLPDFSPARATAPAAAGEGERVTPRVREMPR